MIGAVEKYDLSGASKHVDHLAGLMRQDGVGGSMKEEEVSVCEFFGSFTATGLGGKGDHSGDGSGGKTGRGPDCHCSSKRVTQDHEPLRPIERCEFNCGQSVVDTAVKIVRLSVAHPKHSDPLVGESPAELVVQATVWTEQATHCAADADNDCRRVLGAVTQDCQKTRHGVDLDVFELIIVGHGLHGQRPQPVQWGCRLIR